MADLLQNFAFCALTASITAGATSIPVDECARLPSNAQMSASDFWMTIESTYAANAFEIVKVTAKSATSGPGSLTVVRGQDGTAAAAHPSGTFVKGTLTAGIAGRLGYSGRATASYTTAALAAGATETGLITMALSYQLIAVTVSAAARVQVYETAAARTADASRAVGTDPASSGSGLVLDYLAAGAGTYIISPIATGSNLEASPSTGIPISITATGAGAVTVTFTYLRME